MGQPTVQLVWYNVYLIWCLVEEPLLDIRPPQLLQFEGEVPLHVGDVWHGTEAKGLIPVPWSREPRVLWRASAIAGSGFALQCLALAQEGEMMKEPDSVDNAPSYEMYLISDAQYKTKNAEKLLIHFVDSRLTPYVRRKFSCPDCTVCTALMRRFQDTERSVHPYHFDGQAFVTCVVALNPDEYEGGLYVQGLEAAEERRFVSWRSGDMVCHQFDLGHGVHILKGSRYSLIFWFTESVDSCASDARPHNRLAAQGGNAAAQFNLAQMYERGDGVDEDMDAAISWYLKAAEQGHDLAEVRMGTAYLFGTVVEPNKTLAMSWCHKAGAKGNPTAQMIIGGLYQRKNLTAAREWYHKAAVQEKADAQFLYGNILEKADVMDVKPALAWWHRAARGGSVGAQVRLGNFYRHGWGVLEQDFEAAVKWYKKAMAAGSNAGKSALVEMGILRKNEFLEKTEI